MSWIRLVSWAAFSRGTMTSMTQHTADEHGSVESWLVSAGRDRRLGSPLNVPPIPASNFVLGDVRVYARDDGTPG